MKKKLFNPKFLQTLLQNQHLVEFIGKMPTVKQLFFSVLGVFVLGFLFLALLSYDGRDPAWSHVSTQEYVTNVTGRLGAWVSDILQLFFGLGAWWLIIVLCYEMLRLWWKRDDLAWLVWQLRFVAYAVLLLFISGLLAQWGATQSPEHALWLGGVMGFELHKGLVSLMGMAATTAFLLVMTLFVLTMVMGIRWGKLFGFHKKAPPSGPNDDQTPDAPSDTPDTPLFEPVPEPVINTHAAPKESLGEFLSKSGLREDLLQNGDKDITSSENQNTDALSVSTQHTQSSTTNQPINNPLYQGTTQFDDPNDKYQYTHGIRVTHVPADVRISQNSKADKAKKAKTAQANDVPQNPQTDIEQTKTTQQTSTSANVDLSAYYPADGQFNDDLTISDFNTPNTPDVSVEPDTVKTQSKTQPINTDDSFSPNAKASESTLAQHMTDLYQEIDTLGDLTRQDLNQAQAYNLQTQKIAEELLAAETPKNEPVKPLVTPSSTEDSTDDLVTFIENDLQHTQNSAQTTVQKPDITVDSNKSRAMSTLEYRMSLSPIPELSILDPKPIKQAAYSDLELQQLSELLEIKLQEFNVSAKVVNATVGPVVTRFEVDLAAGVKASRVTKISQDLARSMSMPSLRVLPIIAGKPYIGIEVPNHKRQIISLIELLETPDYQDPDSGISIAVGADIEGKPVIADLAAAPHMLVAGTTGSGKSVLVNSFLLSMILKYTPDELKLVLIDPKQLELANYSDIPHLLTPVITDMTEATAVLNWCVNEMERRYHLMSLLKVRQLSEFNKKIRLAEQNGQPIIDPLWSPDDSVSITSAPAIKPLPKIVVVADEFADMIMQLGKTAEEPIVRLAQKSRAAGIHLLLATQRPVAQVVTGLIKSNIPSRVALRVNSGIDSRLIIDETGAEDMLGHGDMMFIAPKKNFPERVHGAFVKDDEVNRVTDAWRERGTPDYIDLSDSYSFAGEGSGNQDAVAGNSDDDYYDQAVAFFMETRKVSISSLQRKLSIGFNKAARLVDMMEERGVVSAPDNGNKRQLLI